MSIHSFDRAIIGAGPVGLIAALESARHSHTILVITGCAESAPPPRLETVPAALVNLLIDYGIHPRRIGVDRLYDTRYAAWETETPQILRGRAVAHVDLTTLHGELLDVVRHTPGLTLLRESKLPIHKDGCWRGSIWRSRMLLDATGRSMAFAERRVRPHKPWVARPFWTQSSSRGGDAGLRIAALSFGYAYRLGTGDVDMLWIVGRGASLSRSPAALDDVLRAGAAWLLDGFPCLDTAFTSRAYPASVQWAENSPCTAIGDAALARDILSSLGLATGISDALRTVNAKTAALHEACVLRKQSERAAHLRSLAQLLATCRFCERANWAQYRRFIASHSMAEQRGDGASIHKNWQPIESTHL